jgi:hypothetical protein
VVAPRISSFGLVRALFIKIRYFEVKLDKVWVILSEEGMGGASYYDYDVRVANKRILMTI